MNVSKIMQSVDFINTLYKIDRDFFEEAKKNASCPKCGQKLDASNYLRKPRGGTIPPDLCLRFSLCCRQDGCRKRYLPSSIRFYKGFIHWLHLVLLASNFMAPTSFRRKRLMKLFSVSYRTIKRWESYWNDTFPKTSLFKTLRGIVLGEQDLIKSMFELNLDIIVLLRLFKDSAMKT